MERSPLPPSVDGALAALRSRLEPCGDVVFRSFTLGSDPPAAAAAVYCKSLVDEQSLSDQVLQSLMLQLAQAVRAGQDAAGLAGLIRQVGLPVGEPQQAGSVTEAVEQILDGSVALVAEGCAGALLVPVKARVGRKVAESTTEGVVRGPRDAFVEEMGINLTLLRRRLPVPEFRLEQRKVGSRTRTQVALVYLDGFPKPGVLEEVRRRLDEIKIDGILESAYLEELIEDHPYSPFPTIEHTERPDKVVASLLEGRVAILTANTPFALLVPVSFAQFLQAAEDYYGRFIFGSTIRMLRYLAFLIALLLPSLWVAVTTYHHEMIPSALFIALAASREGVPWPAIVEALLMELSFELLREAGVRLPRPVGQAVSIVGGLVVGEAAIRANIASPAMVIVVALTGIASFAVPAFDMALALRLLRFPMMILASTLGLHGVVVALMILLVHLTGLRSFGVPYLSPVTPASPADWKDLVVRAPWWQMRRRPEMLSPGDSRRRPGQQQAGKGGGS